MSNVLEKTLWLSTVPLVSIDINGLPSGIASGCFIEYSGKRILLSVHHATGNGNVWAIQQQYIPSKGTELYRLSGINFLVRANIQTQEAIDVDFSYVEVPESTFAKRQTTNPDTFEIVSEEFISILKPSLKDVPNKTSTYGFSGLVQPSLEKHLNNAVLVTEPRVYTNLQFLRTEGDLHYFKLPFPHPGHEHFKGCSGAPIISKEGVLVALVCGGSTQEDELWGVSLKAYKLPIDILVNDI